MLARFLLLIAALTFTTGIATAADHPPVQVQLDATQLRPGLLAGQAGEGQADDTWTRLAVGDTLTVDFSFLPGQTLLLNQPLSFSLLAGSRDLPTSITFSLRNSLSLQGADGQVLASFSSTQTSNGNAIQALFFADQFALPMGTPSGLSLSGLRFSATVLAYGDGSSAHDFGNPLLAIVAGGMTSTTAPVPEPGALWMALAGIGALWLWRSRGRLPAAAASA